MQRRLLFNQVLRVPACLKEFGPGVWWMLARNPYLPSTFGNQVGDELTAGGVNTTHYSRVFVYLILQSTSDWQVNSDGLKLNGAAVGTTPYAIIDSGIRFSPGPTTDVESIARPFEFVDHHLFQPRVHRRLQCHVQCRIQRRRCRLRDHQEGPSDLLFEQNFLFGLTTIDFPAIRGKSWILVDVFMRKYCVKLDVMECMKHLPKVRRSTGSRVRSWVGTSAHPR